MIDYTNLSKTMSRALRHTPWHFELELDMEGWVPLEQLLESLRNHRRFQELQREDIEEMMRVATKQRFELEGARIRALYGHSVPGKLVKQPAEPPAILYHGTVGRFIPAIRANGLLPMKRQYVHLSEDITTARLVAGRKGAEIVLLEVKALEAYRQHVPFYLGNEQVWLADKIPPTWIDFPSN